MVKITYDPENKGGPRIAEGMLWQLGETKDVSADVAKKLLTNTRFKKAKASSSGGN